MSLRTLDKLSSCPECTTQMRVLSGCQQQFVLRHHQSALNSTHPSVNAPKEMLLLASLTLGLEEQHPIKQLASSLVTEAYNTLF